MSRTIQSLLVSMSLLTFCSTPGMAQQHGTPVDAAPSLNQAFQGAVAAYDAGNFAEATTQLKQLLRVAPKSFEAHELLGLSYAAQSNSEGAVEQLDLAVKLKPTLASARTNLATALVHADRPDEAEAQYRKALALDPHDYSANHNLAEMYASSNRIADALPLFEAAQRAQPDTYGNAYDLALAYLMANKLAEARQQVDSLAAKKDAGELHTLRGRIDEKEGRFVEAANEFGTAAHLDPSEDSLFAWASELLLHRTYDPAIEVFEQGAARYPQSPRLLIGLGMALYSKGEYEKSIRSLIAAADIDPRDPRCYLFLSKAYLSSPNQAEDVILRFRHYAELEPTNALAQYYYAVSIWKGRRLEQSDVDYKTVESLLLKSVALDATIADAHLQLGILYNDQKQYDKSFPEYKRALQLNPSLADAHYRLGQYYVHAGDKTEAQAHFDTYKKLQTQHQALVDKERAEVQQFVISTNGTSSAKP